MPSAARPLLTVNEIEAYYGRVCALHSVSLEVTEGSVVALLGANGAGKTTTLRVISGLLRPTRGSVDFDGKRIDGWTPDRMVRAGIVQVPEGRQIFAELTVRENLLLGGYARRDLGAAREGPPRVFEYFPRLRERLHAAGGRAPRAPAGRHHRSELGAAHAVARADRAVLRRAGLATLPGRDHRDTRRLRGGHGRPRHPSLAGAPPARRRSPPPSRSPGRRSGPPRCAPRRSAAAARRPSSWPA